jgi:CheY-like chemotaxis protein
VLRSDHNIESKSEKVGAESEMSVKSDSEKVVAVPRPKAPALRVLLVDDVPSCRKLLSKLLQTENVVTEEAKDGVEAVDKMRLSFASGELFDGVFMDASMPKMNGLEATRQIRELGYVGKIYGVTGNALAEDVADFIRHGADAVRIKPVSKVGILEMLKGAYDSYCILLL